MPNERERDRHSPAPAENLDTDRIPTDVGDGYDCDYMTISEERAARRMYGRLAEDVEDLQLARAVGQVDRAGRSYRSCRMWGEAS